MSAEEILYKAHEEGIREDVFKESKKLRAEDPKWKYTEYSDCIEEAYRRVVERNKKNNENI